MLPDFRLLFATVVLAVSVLVFGVGAAALLRAAHGNFSNLVTANVSREEDLARERDARNTTLALLRVEMIADQNEHMPVMVATPEAAVDEHAAVPSDANNGAVMQTASANVDAANDAPQATQAQTIDPVSQSAATATDEPKPIVVAKATPTPDSPVETATSAAPAESIPPTQAVALADPAATQVTTKTPDAIAAMPSRKVSVAKKAARPRRVVRRQHHLIARTPSPTPGPQAMQQQARPNSPFGGFGTR